MTLARQLIIVVIALFALLYSGNLLVSLLNARTLVDEQMQVHVQDTATSLGISVGQAAKNNDITSMEVLFNAVSDNGYYQRIYFSNLEGSMLLDRTFSVDIEGVPQWFISLMALPIKEGRAEVASGWVRLGQVVVVGHPNRSYITLWNVILQQLAWFSIVTLITCFIGYMALRWLLEPLSRVEEQANTIVERQFSILTEIPKTRELGRVVEAMNRMSERLKSIFDNQREMIERLQLQAYRDPVTGLSNRAAFDARLKSVSTDIQGQQSGALFLIALSDLTELNNLLGRVEGNRILKKLGQLILKEVSDLPQPLVSRRQGLEFTVFLESIGEADTKTRATSLFAECRDAILRMAPKAGLTVHMGYTYQQMVVEAKPLLIEADKALKHAKSSSHSSMCDYGELTQDETPHVPVLIKSLNEWETFITRCLNTSSIKIFQQTIFDAKLNSQVGVEIFTRFMDGGEELSAATILPFAERLELSEIFDRKVLQNLSATPLKGFLGNITINLTSSSVRSKTFHQWLKEYLEAHRQLAARLVFEIKEQVVHDFEADVKKFQQVISHFDSQLSVDNFGLESLPFSYLQSLPLDYLKVHRSFISGVETNLDNQFYIQSLQQLASSRDIVLVVEGVETKDELETLKSIGVDYVQGFYLARPELIHKD